MRKTILSVIFAGFLVLNFSFYDFSFPIFSQQLVQAQTSDIDGIIPSGDTGDKSIDDFAKKIEKGQVGLVDVVFIIVKMIDLASKLAGTVAVAFLIYGGYQYMIGGLTDDKESAKKTIQYAVMGLIVTFMAYIIVYLVRAQFISG